MTQGEQRMGKASATFILIIITIITVSIVPSEPWKPHTPTVTIESKYNMTGPGQTFLVNITASDVTNLCIWVINMSWDPTVIKLSTGDQNGLKIRLAGKTTYYNIYEGPFMKSIGTTRPLTISQINNTAGTITRLSGAFISTGNPASGSGVIVTINFTLLKKGTTTIDINGPSTTYLGHPVFQDSSFNEMVIEVVDGSVTEGGPPPIWTQFWFLATVLGVIVIILEIYLLFKLITRRPTKPPEEKEEISIAIP